MPRSNWKDGVFLMRCSFQSHHRGRSCEVNSRLRRGASTASSEVRDPGAPALESQEEMSRFHHQLLASREKRMN